MNSVRFGTLYSYPPSRVVVNPTTKETSVPALWQEALQKDQATGKYTGDRIASWVPYTLIATGQTAANIEQTAKSELNRTNLEPLKVSNPNLYNDFYGRAYQKAFDLAKQQEPTIPL